MYVQGSFYCFNAMCRQWVENSWCNSYFWTHFGLPYFQIFKKKIPLGLICALCVSLWLGVIHLKDSIDWPIFDEIWYEPCVPGGRSNPVLNTLPRAVITIRRIDVLVRGKNNQRAFLLDSEMTSCNIFFFLLALRPNSGSWPPLTGFPDHTHSTKHIR